MANDDEATIVSTPPEQPGWFTPKRLLIIFCAINLLNYVDRGAIASNGVNGEAGDSTCVDGDSCSRGSGIQGDFGLDNYHDGIIASAFMVGLLVASPIFAELSNRFHPFRLIGVGLSFWTFATAGCGLSVDFWSITFFRTLVGIGEASFVSLAAPFIDDNAPPEQRTIWLSIFYMCIPVGVAIGYVYGGLVGWFLHWRAAFWIEALLMLPFAIFGFVSRPVQLKVSGGQVESRSSDKETSSGFFKQVYSSMSGLGSDVKILFSNNIYATNVIGYVAFNFVLGAYSYWGPKAGQSIYNINNADILFGIVTIISGVAGTIFGGVVLDYIGSTVSNGLKLLAVATFVGGIGCFCAFLSQQLWLFILLLAVGEFFVFATQGPVNYVSIRSVSPDLRPLAMAMSTVAIHVFGDVPSSPLVGKLQDKLQNWRITALLLTCIYFLAAAIWAIGSALRPNAEIEQVTGKSFRDDHSGKSQEVPFLQED